MAAEYLTLVKLDLQLSHNAFDALLEQYIDAARTFIRKESGKEVTDSADDIQIVVMYASYLYRKRAAPDTEMPRMLRWALNNRAFGGENHVT